MMKNSLNSYKIVFLYGENKTKIEKEINNFKKSNDNFYKLENKIISENSGLLIDKICAQNLFLEQEIILIENINSKDLILIKEIIIQYLNQSHNLLIITLNDEVDFNQLPQNNPHILNLLCENENKDEKFTLIENLIRQYNLNLNLKQKNFILGALFKQNIFFIEGEIKKLSLLAYNKQSLSNQEIARSLDLKPNYYINNIIDDILTGKKDWYKNFYLLTNQIQPLVILKIITSQFIKLQKSKNITPLKMAKILKNSLECELEIKLNHYRGEFLIMKFLHDLQLCYNEPL